MGRRYSQHPWSPMEFWYGAQPASMESHGDLVLSTGIEYRYGEVVWKPGSFHGVPWKSACGNLAASMESHEKSVLKVSLVEYHEELVECGCGHSHGVP